MQTLDVSGKPGISSTDMFTLFNHMLIPLCCSSRRHQQSLRWGPQQLQFPVLSCTAPTCCCVSARAAPAATPWHLTQLCPCAPAPPCTPLFLRSLLRHAITLLLPSAVPCMQVVSLTAGICVASWVLCYCVLSYLAGSSLLPHLTGKMAAAAATLGATIMMARSPASAVSRVWSVECGDKGAGGRGWEASVAGRG